MSLDNFRNRTILWDTVNKDFPQPIQTMQGDVNARTLLIKIVDNGTEVDLTGHSLKLTYQHTNSSNSGFVMIPPKDLAKGEFILAIPTEMTATGVIEANLILLNKDKEQVIVSKNLTFISDSSTVSDLAQEINNNIDDFTKLLLENMPQVMRSELNDLHAQTDSNKSNIELKANLADMTSLQSAMTELKKEVEAFGISPENLVTIKSLLEAIARNASESEVVELINSVKVLTSNISLMSNGDYSPKANQTDLESLQHTVNDHSATISAKANQTDLDNLQANVSRQGIAISTKAEQSDLSITNKNVATAQETANKAESEAKNAMAKATEAQANSLPLNGTAVSAIKLATPRKLRVNLQSSSFQDFDGTADATNIGVSGVLPIANGGTATSNGVINTIAYANSADGTDGFTTVYPNFNLLNFKSGLKIGVFLAWIDGLTLERNPARAIFDYVSVIPGATYTINANWDKTERIAIYAYDSNDGKNATFIYDGSSAKWVSPSVIGRVITQKTTISIPDGINFIRIVFFAKDTSAKLTLQDILDAKVKLEPGPIATPWMPSASEVTIADYPKYVGFSNSIKPNKKSSDYKWLPMGLVSIDRATGSLKPAVIGIDCAEAHPVGSVVTNISNSSSGYSTGKWENIGSAVIGSTTIYYWKRTA
ncbi:neck passage structure [Lactococcus phage 936 group phage PhiM.16]|nr:neck passage structure [Lactococcus phage 936 group phage PhiM.16]